jgi:hypothetical protein
MRSLANCTARQTAALKQWRRWQRARYPFERRRALCELWELCNPEVWAAAGRLAGRLSEARGESVTVPKWLALHGWEEADAEAIAFPAVQQAAKNFDPARGSFPTFAHSHILGELHRAAKTRSVTDALLLDENAVDPGRGADALPSKGLWALFELDHTPQPGGSEQGNKLRTLSRDDLEKLAAWCDENKERIVEHYGFRKWLILRTDSKMLAWLTSMPPEEKIVDDGPAPLGIKAMAFPPHGEKVDIAKPFEAARLRRQGHSLREIAERLGIGKNKVARMLERYEAHTSSKFTPADMLRVAAGTRRGRPKKS